MNRNFRCPECGRALAEHQVCHGDTVRVVPEWIDNMLEPRPYVAANLLAALDLVTDTGDWHGQLRQWCEAHLATSVQPNPGLGVKS